jgi:hypothetical protein
VTYYNNYVEAKERTSGFSMPEQFQKEMYKMREIKGLF